MSEETKDTQDEAVIDLDALNKSWEDSKSNVLNLLGEAPEPESTPIEKSETEEAVPETPETEAVEEVEKSDDGDKDDTGKMDYKEEEDDEDEEEDVSKSIEETLDSSEDGDVSNAMDAEPFLRDLVKSVDTKFGAVTDALGELTKGLVDTNELQKATAKMFASFGDLQKGMANTVEAIGNSPVPSKSVIRGAGERFEKSEADDQIEDLGSKEKILTKSLKLASEGKMTGRMLTKIEGRLNKKMDLSPEMIQILKEEA